MYYVCVQNALHVYIPVFTLFTQLTVHVCWMLDEQQIFNQNTLILILHQLLRLV